MLDCTVKEIKAKLNDRIIDVVSSLLPHGKQVGNEWIAGDANGSSGKSLKVHLAGDKVGVWSDFATGESGDIINLWCIVRNLSFLDAMNEIRQKLGVATPKMSMSNTTKNYVRPRLPQISQALSDESTAIKYLTEERKLTLQTLQKYRITTSADQILFPYYRGNELIMIKYLNVFRDATGKKEMSVSANCEPCLFGWQAVERGDLRSVVIVEGEIDAMTLTQYGIPHIVLSVPYGGGIGDKQKWIAPEFDNLIIFDEIFLCLDNDKAGQDAMQEIAERLGKHRCRMVRLPCKDANECLQNGVSAERIEQCFVDAVSFDPLNLRYWSLFADDSENRFEPPNGIVPGYRLPWPKTAGKILFRPNEVSVWTGINGHGKSLFVGQVMLGCMKQGAKVCIASMEMPPGYVLHHLVQQTAGLELPSKEYRSEIYRWYDEKGWIFDIAGNANVEQMLGTFEYAMRKYAVDVFMIDSFMCCGVGEDDFTGQKKLMEQLCRFVRQNNCHLHIIVHPRKGADESQMPGKMDMKGTGAISDLASNCFCIWRNKQKEEKLARIISKSEVPPRELVDDADCWLRCDKQRSGDWEGRIPFWFDKGSHSYVEKANQRPIALVEYSNIIKLHG